MAPPPDETRPDDAETARSGPTPENEVADGAREAAAAAAARGFVARPVRTDRLLDGDVQHVVTEPPHDPSIVSVVVGALVLAAVLGVVGVVAGLVDSTILQGIAMGGALILFAVALVLAATRMLPEELTVQQRHEAERPPSGAPAVDTSAVLGRRSVLGAAGAALGAIGAAVLLPARGIGPAADESLRVTAWQEGARAVDEFGALVRAERVPFEGIVTVWPEGHEGDAQSQAVLLRVEPTFLTDATLRHGTADGLIAYSKICTHAGCAIAQFSADDEQPDTSHLLVCPCHQSRFDVTEQAAPVGGPATRPLAQLPVGVDDAGVVVAMGDFLEPPGPAWWSR